MSTATKEACCGLQRMSDEELMGLVAAECDHEAFAELFRRWQQRVFWCVLRRLGHWQWAEDVTAEVFAKLFAIRSRYQAAVGLFRRWLFHLARIAVLQCQKRRGRDFAEMAFDPPDAPRDAETDQQEEERAYQLRLGVDRLPPKQAAAVTAVWLEGETIHTFAKASGRAFSSVDSSIYGAMRNLHADKALAALV